MADRTVLLLKLVSGMDVFNRHERRSWILMWPRVTLFPPPFLRGNPFAFPDTATEEPKLTLSSAPQQKKGQVVHLEADGKEGGDR
mmetsp:Transcript_35438/g.72515  ORF Transcript_35438/g.72515 Transcript_35438/m.72515 type:complete len:85 (+) Transcript_35438:170-424(+)